MSNIDIQLTCPDCDETFSSSPQDILDNEFIVCPNCGCQLPDDELRYLKLAINYMQEKKTH